MSNNSSDKVGLTLAMILTFVGLIIITGGTFFGMALLGKSLLFSIVCAALVFALAGVCVFLGAHAKTAQTDFTKWARLKWVCLAGLIVAVVLSLWPTMIMFNYLGAIGNLRNSANDDIAGMSDQLNTFRAKEQVRVARLRTGLESLASMHNPSMSSELIEYLENRELAVNGRFVPSEIDPLIASDSSSVENIAGREQYGSIFQTTLSNMSNSVVTAGPLTFVDLRERIPATAEYQDSVLTAVSAAYDLRSIVGDEHASQFELQPGEPNEYRYKPTSFVEQYKKLLGFRWGSLALAIAAGLATLLHFVMTVPSLRKRVDDGHKNSDQLGLTL